MTNFTISELYFARMWTNFSIVLNPRWFLAPAPWVWVFPQDQAGKDDDWLGRSTGEEKLPHPFFSVLGKLPVGKHLRTSCGNFLFDFHARGGWEWKSGHIVGVAVTSWNCNFDTPIICGSSGEKSSRWKITTSGRTKSNFQQVESEKLMPSQIAQFQSRKAC